MISQLPIRQDKTRLLLSIRVTPNANKNAIETFTKPSEGQPVLKIKTTAQPEKGKANASTAKQLAKYFDIPKSAVTIISGLKDRNKTIAIEHGPDGTYLNRVTEKLLTQSTSSNRKGAKGTNPPRT